MVKADYNRDYYADLELPQNADVNDVKKQFRKLALKYHPDRNPGREAEVNAKFQTIQAAHEILTSPEQRSKYDAQRSRRFPGASNVRGNPWADVGRNFPPPPQRNRPNASSASTRPTSTASSADRYSRFPNPPPPPPRPAEDPRSRAEAFESMRPKPRPRAPTAAQSGAHSGSSSSGASTRTRPADPRQTAYTASQQKKAEASFGNRTGRSSRSGFVPGSPMGDEPPVTSSNYMSGRRHTSLFDETAAPPPVPPRERADHGTGAGADDGFPPNLDPRSSPYQTRSGERLNPFEGRTSVNRARSTRESQRRAEDDHDHFATPNHRQRSFSVSDEPEGVPYPATEPRQANISRKATANTGKVPDSVRSPRFGDQFPSNPGPGVSAASSGGYDFQDGSMPSATSGAATDGFHGTRTFRDSSDPHSNVYDVADPTAHPSAFPFEASPARPMAAANATASVDRRSHSVWNSGSRRLSSGGRSMSAYSDLNFFEQKQFDLLDKLVGKEPMRKGGTGSVRASQSKETRHPPESLNQSTSETRYHRYKETDKFECSSFPQNPTNARHPDAADPSSFARNGADSINTRFVPDEHSNVNWQFNAGGDYSTSTNGAGARRAQSGSRLGRRSPTKGRSRVAAGMAAGAAAATAAGMAATGAYRNAGSGSDGSSDDEGTDPRAHAEIHPPSSQQQQDPTGFDADVWSDKIGSEHFVPVPPSRGSGSPSRPMRPPKRRPTVRMTKGGSAGLVEEEDTTSGEDRAGGAAVEGMDNSNAMDIDTPMGEPTTGPQAAAANGVRGVPVEPSRPEWRAGDANGFAAAAPAAVPGSDPPGIRPRFNVSNAAGSEDTDELRGGFDELKNIEPIAQRAAGLNSFDDLKSQLPFESRASVNLPVDKAKGNHETSIEFPKPPVPPSAPAALAISGLKPSGSVWESHVHEFEIYLREWDNFNSKFVDHVLARQNQLNKAKQKNGLSLLYTRSAKSIQEYAAWLEQDQQVHEKWTAYHNEHLKRVREFMAHQEKMKE